MLQEQIKRQLGIDVIELEGGDDLTGSMVTVGKYLSPKLSLSLGRPSSPTPAKPGCATTSPRNGSWRPGPAPQRAA
jgi:autotransporter translocation and assembly factor TamB